MPGGGDPPVLLIDTNVVAAGLITARDDSPPGRILDAMLDGRLLYLLSPDLLDEYRAVLLRPKPAALHGLTPDEIDRVLIELVANAVWREPAPPDPAPDRGDDHLGALLAAHPKSGLVTGDRLLLENPPAGVSVISPRVCVERFVAE